MEVDEIGGARGTRSPDEIDEVLRDGDDVEVGSVEERTDGG